MEHAEIIDATRRWLERAVIGLALCPFAAPVYQSGRLRLRISEAVTTDELIVDLVAELRLLASTDPAAIETTLLVHPRVCTDFLEYNDFLETCEATVAALELEGTLQVASFHPQYQFADSAPDDISNYTNRAPYPTLHLLREDSVERAVDSIEDPDEIYRANIRTLQALGLAGWVRLWKD